MFSASAEYHDLIYAAFNLVTLNRVTRALACFREHLRIGRG